MSKSDGSASSEGRDFVFPVLIFLSLSTLSAERDLIVNVPVPPLTSLPFLQPASTAATANIVMILRFILMFVFLLFINKFNVIHFQYAADETAVAISVERTLAAFKFLDLRIFCST